MENYEPQLTLDQTLWECFCYFAHADEMNAAIHTAIVRYSPITFRLAEHLAPVLDRDFLTLNSKELLIKVLQHKGSYAEDQGR